MPLFGRRTQETPVKHGTHYVEGYGQVRYRNAKELEFLEDKSNNHTCLNFALQQDSKRGPTRYVKGHGGVKIAYTISKEADSERGNLLMLTGLNSVKEDWRAVRDELCFHDPRPEMPRKGTFRMVAMDNRCTGESELGVKFGVHEIAQDALAVLKQDTEEYIHSVIFFNTGLQVDRLGAPLRIARALMTGDKAGQWGDDHKTRAGNNTHGDERLAIKNHSDQVTVRHIVSHNSQKSLAPKGPSSATFEQILCAYSHRARVDDLATKIGGSKILIVNSTSDHKFTVANGKELCKKIAEVGQCKSPHFVELRGAGHALHNNEARWVTALISKMVDAVSRSSREHKPALLADPLETQLREVIVQRLQIRDPQNSQHDRIMDQGRSY